jgi:hypothetical protein
MADRYTFDKKSVDRLAKMSRDYLPRKNDIRGGRAPKVLGDGGDEGSPEHQGQARMAVTQNQKGWSFIFTVALPEPV